MGLLEVCWSQYYRSNSAFSHQCNKPTRGAGREGPGREQLRARGRRAAGRDPDRDRDRRGPRRPPRAASRTAPALRLTGRGGARRLRGSTSAASLGGNAGPGRTSSVIPPARWGWSRCSRPGATSGGGSSGSAPMSARSCWRGRPTSR